MNFIRLITVEPVLFLYMLMVFMEMNTLQSLFITKVCLTIHHPQNLSDCAQKSYNDVEVEAVSWNKYYSTCLYLCTFLVSFYVASWSDYFSHKVTMIIPPIGTFIAASINATLSFFLHTHVAYFLISAVVSGLTFGTVGIIASTFKYLTDIVPEESRTERIIILEMMIFVGGTLGFYITGGILHNTDLDSFFNDYAKVFVLEMVLAAVIILYISFRIPYRRALEEVPLLSSEQTLPCLQVFSLQHVKYVVHAVFKRRPSGKRNKILLLMFSLIFLYYGLNVQLTLSLLYLENEPLKWTTTEFSNYSALLFSIESLALLLGTPLFFHYMHVSDPVIAMVGVTSRIAGLVLFGLSTTKAMVYSCCLLFTFSEFAVPAVRSMLSKLVDETERGKIFAFTTILQNLCFFSASFVLSSIFQSSIFIFPGLCFEIVAGLQVISFIIFCYLRFAPGAVVTVYEIMEDDGEISTASTVPKELRHPTA